MNIEWTSWKAMPQPENCKQIEGPEGPGVYQIRNRKTNEFIQFGESKTCQLRMCSLYPKPFGTGTRNNENKRIYVLNNWRDLDYRTAKTDSKEEAVKIDRLLKAQKNHLFNT